MGEPVPFLLCFLTGMRSAVSVTGRRRYLERSCSDGCLAAVEFSVAICREGAFKAMIRDPKTEFSGHLESKMKNGDDF